MAIPQNVLYKIFQPLYVTESAGQGTGLGLSISRIIIKAPSIAGKIKIILCKILLFLFPLLHSFTSHAQNETMDSLQKVLQSLQIEIGDKTGLPDSFLNLKNIFSKGQQLDEAFEYLNKGLSIAKELGDIKKLQGGYYNLSLIDSAKGNYKQAFEHYKLYTLYRDSLVREETAKKSLQAKMQYEFDKKQAVAKAEQDKKDAEQKRIKNLQYFTIAGLIVLLLVILLIAFIQWRNNNQKKKANVLLQQQKEKVEDTLTELKSTQSQLIHSEKMASLGELTAGIAHEIQNPLNFVNNFSEVNTELIEEMKEEIDKGNIREIKTIADDIKENELKINHHGKRAEAIVKGMLQHSRSSSGVKETTDINELADEYLRLAYHGLRAKDQSFNATLKTDFDESIGNIKIIPQDIGRVLLNLFNNAFYTVTEKKNSPQPPPVGGGVEYEPTVSVGTKKTGDKVLISVKDNGNGIPQKVVDKIFQPFFTTKPPGQGTGLGLSLAYDFVKAHGGELKVETKEGEGAEFIIQLPLTYTGA